MSVAVGVAALSALSLQAADTANAPYRMDTSVTTRIEITALNSDTLVSAPSKDGGFYIGGAFTTIAGHSRLGLAKFKADGTIDATFNATGGFNGRITLLRVQPDGRLMVAGNFTRFNETARKGIARLNTDGTLDASFNPSALLSQEGISIVTLFAVQADGRILVSGEGKLLRLNADGTLASRLPYSAGIGYLQAIAVQPNGKILIAGFQAGADRMADALVARLNADGTTDTSFKNTTKYSNPNPSIVALAVQADGRILVGGSFSVINDQSGRSSVVRLNADGNLDTGFNPGSGAQEGDGTQNGNGTVKDIVLNSDGRILVSGLFNKFNGAGTAGVVRLNANGSVDTGFNASGSAFAHSSAATMSVQTNGKIALAGVKAPSTESGSSTPILTRLNADGKTDTSFSMGRIADSARHVVAVPTSGGKFYVGGLFESVDGVSRNAIARLNANGTLDTAFNPGTGIVANPAGWSHPVSAIAVQSDGNVLIGGMFTSYNGANARLIVRLKPDGTRDTTFKGGAEIAKTNAELVDKIVVQSDGRILASTNSALLRLNADGSRDTSFTSAIGSDASIFSVTVQSDAKILVSGYLKQSNGSSTAGLLRLNANGSRDTSFTPGTFNDLPSTVVLQPNGQILVSGQFTKIGDKSRKNVARLNANGSVDTAFDASAAMPSVSDPVNGITLQSDGRIVVLVTNRETGPRFIQLKANGSLDSSFAGTDFVLSSESSTVTSLSDGRLLVSGWTSTAFRGGVIQRGVVILKK